MENLSLGDLGLIKNRLRSTLYETKMMTKTFRKRFDAKIAAAKKIQRFAKRRFSARSDKNVTGGAKRGDRGNSQAIVLSRNPNSHVVFPNQVEVTLETPMEFYWPAGTMTSAAGNYMAVKLNSIIQPFNPATYPFSLIPGATFACNASAVQGFAANNGPLWQTTYQNLYARYIVVKYKLEITVVPGQAADMTRVVTIPLGGTEIVSGVAANVNCRVFEAQAYALAKTCSSATVAGAGNNNTLVLSGAPYKDLGLTRDQYFDAISQYGALIASSPSQLAYGGVFFQQLNGSNNGAACTCQCKLTQTVRFMDLVEPTA